MIKFGVITNENSTIYKPNYLQNLDHSYRILIMDRSETTKKCLTKFNQPPTKYW